MPDSVVVCPARVELEDHAVVMCRWIVADRTALTVAVYVPVDAW